MFKQIFLRGRRSGDLIVICFVVEKLLIFWAGIVESDSDAGHKVSNNQT